jgi:hypothetical protein
MNFHPQILMVVCLLKLLLGCPTTLPQALAKGEIAHIFLSLSIAWWIPLILFTSVAPSVYSVSCEGY